MKIHVAGIMLAAFAFAAGEAKADTFAFNILAGGGVSLASTNGAGPNARFFNATGAAVDSSGNVYIADGGDHTVRIIAPGGTVATFAGVSGQAGNVNGASGSALFDYPYAVAVDASGNVYVSDPGNNNIRKIAQNGSVTTLAGSGGAGSVDGPGGSAEFNSPMGIAVDSAGNVFVCDTNNCTIRKITASGTVSTIAGSPGQEGASDGTNASALFNYPEGLAIDSSNNIYVADYGNSTLRLVTEGGAVTTIAGSAGLAGAVDGPGATARFNHPGGVAVDASGHVYVIDTSNQTVRMFTVATGSVSTIAGTAGIGGNVNAATGAAARFFYPAGIASTSGGTLYVADTGNHEVRAVSTTASVSTYAGAMGVSGSTDGTGASALFDYPGGVAVDGSGNVYVADHNNNVIRKISAGGTSSTLAGTAGVTGSANGTNGAASFNGPQSVAVDGNGNVYVADTGNCLIRKITSAGVVTTLAGTANVAGSSNGTGTAAQFNFPQGIAVDGSGNVYVADTGNDTIREITSTGVVTTLAGTAGQAGSVNGTTGAALFNGPYAVSVDSSGNVYVADFFNATIRKISGGAVSTLAGTAGQSNFVDGTGTTARFNQPYSLAVDGSGNVWVADTYNRAVRKVTAGGTVTTVEGPLSRFYYPQGIAVDASGNLYVADGDNQSIDMGVPIPLPPAGAPVGAETAAAGGNATFTVGDSVPSGTSFQWVVSTNGGASWTAVSNGTTYSGATTSSLSVTGATSSMNGNLYEAQMTDEAGTVTSASALLTVTSTTQTGGTGTARLINLSARAFVGTGADAPIVGFVITGTGTKQLLLRGVGPTLGEFGVADPLGTPQLTLSNSTTGVQIAQNTGWGGTTTLAQLMAQVGAFALPANSADCALDENLGVDSYGSQVVGVGNTTGIALDEIYDADTGTPTARLGNLSARAFVGAGAQVLIGGFIVGGSGTETVLIRGDGPALSQFNLMGLLSNPVLTLVDGNDAVIATNVGWGNASVMGSSNVGAVVQPATASVMSQVGAFSLPAGSADCAMIVTLPPGNYTATVSGTGTQTGLGLVEIYEVP